MTAAVIGTSTMFSPSCSRISADSPNAWRSKAKAGPGSARFVRSSRACGSGNSARSSRRRTRIASVLAMPGRRLGREHLRPHHDPVPLALRDRDRALLAARALVDADPDRERRVERQVAGRVAPGAVAEPGVLEADELVEVVAAPLEERAASPKPRELGAQVLAVVEPGDRVRGVPDRGVLDVRVARRAVPVDEGAVDAVAVDEERAAVLELAGSGEHRLEQLGEDALAGDAGGRDPERERLLAGAGAGRERGVQLGGLVGVELVDDVGRGVEAVLEGGVGRQASA